MGRLVPARRRRGQGMTEYIVICGLIAILLIGVIAKFRGQLDASYRKSSDAIAKHVTAPMGGKGKGGMSSSSASMGGSADPLSDPTSDTNAKPTAANKPTSNLKPNQ